MKRTELVKYLAGYLRLSDFKDASWNGLQVEGADDVGAVATAVDPTLAAIRGAAEAGARMLIVHHGFFWGNGERIVGPLQPKIRALLEADISLYAAHLPLDGHPEVGNNAQLARLLDLEPSDGFGGDGGGAKIGVLCTPRTAIPREKLAERLGAAIGVQARLFDLGPPKVKRIGIVSGNGGSTVGEATARRLDCLVTGEWTYTNYQNARDHALNVICGGHYATETVGVRALGEHLAAKFGLEHTFVADPAPM